MDRRAFLLWGAGAALAAGGADVVISHLSRSPRGVLLARPSYRTPFGRSPNNPILSPAAAWEGTAVQEPTVLHDSGTFKMWYTGAWSAEAVGYATCTGDPTVPANWTKYASNPVLGEGGSSIAGVAACNNVVKVGSTYYCYFSDAVGGTGNLKVSTSSDGIAWSAPTTALSKTVVAWISSWANSSVWNEGGTTWKMLVEGKSTGAGTPWVIAYATSTDGLNWTIVGTGPLTSLSVAGYPTGYSGPSLANDGAMVNGRYQLWFHVDSGSFSDIFHAYSTDAQNWTITGPELYADHGTYEKQQAADPSIVEANGVTYLFYSGVNNTTSTSYINVATFPGPVSELVRWK